jgi:hypothetical protein
MCYAALFCVVLLQECWWHSLATSTTQLAGTAAATAASTTLPHLPQHPSKFCVPYHLEQAYKGQVAEIVAAPVQKAGVRVALHVQLVAQLWEVWPWQLEQLQAAVHHESCAPAVPGGSTATAMSAASSSSRTGAGGTAMTCSSRGGSSSSSCQVPPAQTAASLLHSGQLPHNEAAWAIVFRPTGHDWPLLPDAGEGAVQQQEGQGLPPVTLQQLQLTVSAMAHAESEEAVTGALLLALLLQRADPGLRASFLAGPGGTALLAAAQYWGHTIALHPGDPEAFFSLCVPDDKSGICSASQLLALLQGESWAAGWGWLDPGTSLGMLLAWCYLVPVGDWEEEAPAAWGPAPRRQRLVITPQHCEALSQGPGGLSSCSSPPPGAVVPAMHV